jgi:pimeloyl-ACP methyl ester carboxylesterase
LTGSSRDAIQRADDPAALHLHRWGTNGARRALLVHGLAGSGATWWQIADALVASGHEVVAPDLRGHGLSPPCNRYTFANFASDLAPLATEWDLIVGHSLGGPIVASLLGMGVNASRTVLLEPVLEIPDDQFDALMAAQLSEADPCADAANLLAANPTWHALDAHTKAAASRAVAPFTIERVMHDNTPWRATRLLDSIESPILILAADPAVQTMCPATLGARLARRPNVRFEIVRGSGHSLQRDNPAAVIKACTS